MTAPAPRSQPDIGDAIDLVERLRHPLWVHSDAPFGSPQLEKEATETDLAQAAEVIEQYRTDSASDEKLIAALRSRVEELTKALEQIRTAHAGYCITDENQYPGVVEGFWREIQRMDGAARSALSLEDRK